MGIQSDLVIAGADEAEDVRASESPSAEWDGFSFQGLENVKLATLLSLISSRSPDGEYEKWLGELPVVGEVDDRPWLFALSRAAVKSLATIAAQDGEEFEGLAEQWAATDEFEGWEPADVSDLLRSIGDLAESATLERKTMFLWVSG